MKNFILLGASLAAVAVLSAPSFAQCATSGSTFTTNAGGNGQQGNMFDIAPSVDMTIECVDTYWTTAGESIDYEVWYCPITSMGNETNPAAWTLLGANTVATTGAGATAEQIDISGNGVVFSAGQTYGIYVVSINYPVVAGFMIYTTQFAGPTVYTGDHCDITTNAGVFGLWGGTFQTRDYNGELHTELTGPAGPALALSCAAGSATADLSGFSASGPIAVVYGPASAYVHAGAQCNGVALDLTPMTGPIIVFADANGDAQIIQGVPATACGSGLLVQAVDAGTCVASNSAAL